MDTALDPPRPDGRRTGAAWVAATGAFLLVAAATTFVAVRWDQIPDVVKLAIVATTTGSALLAGRSLRRALPATSGVLFHLGAFLIPVDVAAVQIHIGVDWRGMVLAQGLICTAAFATLAMVQRSVVLAWATTAAAVVLAAGVAGPTGVPTPLVVAAFALAAHLLADRLPGDRDLTMRLGPAAVALAALAGTAPLLRLLESLLVPGRSVMVELGLAGSTAGLVAVASGGVAAFVLAGQAARLQDLRVALLALLSAGVGVTATWFEVAPGDDVTAVGIAAGFLAVELLAIASTRDAFWGRPTAVLAHLAEGLAGVAMVPLTLAVISLVDSPSFGRTHHLSVAAASALLAAGWLTADLRRAPTGGNLRSTLLGGSGWTPAAPLIAIAATAAVASATLEPATAGVVLLTAAALAVVGRRPLGAGVCAFAAIWAPLLAADVPNLSIGLGAAGALLVARAVVLREPAAGRGADASHWLLVAVATTVAVITPIAHTGGHSASAFVIAAVSTWAVAVVLDSATRALGQVPRIAALLLVVPASQLSDAGAAMVAGVVALGAVVEAVRHDDVRDALAAALLAPVVLGFSATAMGLTTPEAGLALCVAAAVWLGLASLADSEGSGAAPWALPLAAAAGMCASAGLVLAIEDTTMLANCLLLIGGLVVVAGATRRLAVVAHVGGAIATLGLWTHLALAGVEASEAYLAPVGIQLLAAGFSARRSGTTSTWTAYAPGVVLLGAPGLVERLAGGAGGHALWAGVVATAAVAVGGRNRMAGPLLTGTTLLVALTVTESLAWSVDVPTWAWLAAGGSFLLVTGIAMDRMATGPVETGRRMVDVVRERFE